MEDQIKDLLQNEKVKNISPTVIIEAARAVGPISDVTSSMLYCALLENHNFSNNDLTLTWNTDGNPVFESPSYSIWPIQNSINEL